MSRTLGVRTSGYAVVEVARQWVRSISSRNLILITGCQRSGTTLLLLMLGAHSKVNGFDESEVGHRLPSARHTVSNRLQGKLTCWKQPEESGAIDQLQEEYPHADCVWMARNPLAVVSSMRRLQLDDWEDNWLGLYADDEMEQLSRAHPGAETSWRHLSRVELGARIWRLNCEVMEKYKESGGSTTIVRFEDLIEDTGSELRKVCENIGIEYQARMINFHEESTNQGRVLAGGTRADRALNGSRAAPKIDLSVKEKRDVLEEAGSWAEKLGYV